MKEDKQEFLNKLCELLRMTRAAGTENQNPINEIRYIESEYREIARPIFEEGNGENGWYDINITGDSCIGILIDVVEHFVKEVW